MLVAQFLTKVRVMVRLFKPTAARAARPPHALPTAGCAVHRAEGLRLDRAGDVHHDLIRPQSPPPLVMGLRGS